MNGFAALLFSNYFICFVFCGGEYSSTCPNLTLSNPRTLLNGTLDHLRHVLHSLPVTVCNGCKRVCICIQHFQTSQHLVHSWTTVMCRMT